MGKGWGLTLDTSDHPIGSVFKNPSVGLSLTPRWTTPRKEVNHSSMLTGAGFPVSVPPHDGGSDGGDRRKMEVDFFSNDVKDNIVVKMESNSCSRTDLDVNTGLNLLTTNTISDQSSVDDGVSSNLEDKRTKNELAILQVELERLNTENQRLRGMLTQVNNNYNALQSHLVNLMQQNSRNHEANNVIHQQDEEGDKKNDQQAMVPREFIELGPRGPANDEVPSHDSSSEERTQSGSAINTAELSKGSGKRVGREPTPDSESWGPNKVAKLNVPKSVEQATEATMRKARVSVRARSEAPMITDGCQWRKYGQKMAKGNPCPRAYYRCTMAVGCPVRKQVQRCAEDRTILITTYEGNHNHPLPPAAVAMASTTSAAASMLLSGSMSSTDGLMNPNILARAILPSSSSIATISASAPFPTVTLDLTHTPDAVQRPNPNQFQMPFQGRPQNFPPLPVQPQVFGQGGPYNQSKFSGVQSSHDIQPNQLAHLQQPPPPPPPQFTDTLSAATAAITSDPNFTAALAAAISSIMGGNINAPTTNSATNNGSSTNIPTLNSHTN